MHISTGKRNLQSEKRKVGRKENGVETRAKEKSVMCFLLSLYWRIFFHFFFITFFLPCFKVFPLLFIHGINVKIIMFFSGNRCIFVFLKKFKNRK